MAKQTQKEFKKSNYNVRFLKVEYSRSKGKNNPMFTVEYELANNGPALTSDGKEKMDINGLQGKTWIVFTEKNRAQIEEVWNRLHLPTEDLCFDNDCTDAKHPDPKLLVGLMVNAQVGCEEQFARSAPRPAEIDPETGVQKPAQVEGDLIKDPSTGKSISKGFTTTLQSSEIWYKVEDGAV